MVTGKRWEDSWNPRLQSMAVFNEISGAEKAQILGADCAKQLPSADHGWVKGQK